MAFCFPQLNTAIPRRNTRIEVTLKIISMGCVRRGDVEKCWLKLFQAFHSCGESPGLDWDRVLVQVILLLVLLNVVQIMCAAEVMKSLGFCGLQG